MVDALPEAISNFSLMHRGNPCECGSAPCTSVVPRRTGSVSNLAKTPVRTTSSAPVRRTLRGDSAVKARYAISTKRTSSSATVTPAGIPMTPTQKSGWKRPASGRDTTRGGARCCPGRSGAGAPDTTSSSGTCPTSRNRSTSTSTAMRPTSRRKNAISTKPSRAHSSRGLRLKDKRSGEPARRHNSGGPQPFTSERARARIQPHDGSVPGRHPDSRATQHTGGCAARQRPAHRRHAAFDVHAARVISPRVPAGYAPERAFLVIAALVEPPA